MSSGNAAGTPREGRRLTKHTRPYLTLLVLVAVNPSRSVFQRRIVLILRVVDYAREMFYSYLFLREIISALSE